MARRRAARSQRSHPPFRRSADSVTFPPNSGVTWEMSFGMNWTMPKPPDSFCSLERQRSQPSTTMPSSYITFSIDDGHPKDLNAAELLSKYDLKGTFYIPATNPEREVMSASQIRSIAQDFEVGAHTYGHRPLTRLPLETVRAEVANGKKWLEDIVGSEVISFCYPRGEFSSRVVKVVSECGFLGARTCMFNLTTFPKNPWLWGVTTHAYSHSPTIQIRHALLERNYEGLVNYATHFRFARDWERHFLYGMDLAKGNGGISHLYLHSWELDEHGEWPKLENLLAAVSHRNFVPVDNGELFRLRRHT